MSRLPSIDRVLEDVRAAVAEQEKTAGVSTEESIQEFHSKLAEGLYKCAENLRKRASTDVTYDEVLSLGRQALEQE